MARTKTNKGDNTKILTTSWRNRHLENIYVCVFRNTNIKSNIKPFFFHDWVDKGIVFTKHIYDYRNKQFLA